MKKSLIEKLTQILLIVFSVVLGLYLSERIEDRKNAREADKIMEKIKLELHQNKMILDEWVPYHRAVVNQLDSLINDDQFIADFILDKSNLYQVFTKGSIMKETPSDDAWDIAKSHPLIVNVDYDELLILSKIFNQQTFTYESFPILIDLILSSDFNAKEKALPNLTVFRDRLRDITQREIQLMHFYDQAERLLHYEEP